MSGFHFYLHSTLALLLLGTNSLSVTWEKLGKIMHQHIILIQTDSVGWELIQAICEAH